MRGDGHPPHTQPASAVQGCDARGQQTPMTAQMQGKGRGERAVASSRRASEGFDICKTAGN
ncbi:hypothetical protein K525DRAFT_274927 [Schizophyllum commune Loenen D]|nr:hypothetical protein K525DRAFT_274927 [Schizophyllum commune Loenen D]